MLRWPDGRVRPLLFDGSPLLSSAVFLGTDGQLHTGRDAAHLARSAPERLEPNPKRRVDERAVLLGDTEVGVPELIATVLRRVANEARQVARGVQDVTLTHPTGWGPGRRAVLLDAAERAGLGHARLADEPVAAALCFANRGNGAVPVGACLMVYDLGAGTCDVTILRRHPQGFEVIASDGRGDIGGLDVDAAIVGFLQSTYGDLWTDYASRRQLWDEVRSAKEMLSRTSSTVVAVPALGKEVPLGRQQFEELIQPVLRPTIAMTHTLIQRSNVGARTIAGVFLVGGSSRIPLVATLLHEAMGIPPVAVEQPELVVAEGSLYLTPPEPKTAGPIVAARPASTPVPVSPMPSAPTPVSPMPVSTMPVPQPVSPAVLAPGIARPPMPAPPRQPQRQGRGGLVAAIVAGSIAVLLLLSGGIAGCYALLSTPGSNPNHQAGRTATPRASSVSAVPAKYDLQKLPQNMCEKVDMTSLATVFETNSDSKPDASRNLSDGYGSANCILGREHDDSKKLAISIVTVSFSAYVFSDPESAATSHAKSASDAQLNSAKLTPVPGLGEDAFVYRYASNTASPDTDASYRLDARDSNLHWMADITATRLEGKWSDSERQQIQQLFIASAKATYTKAMTP
jgi:actin-like ATPase involved in cell morphogenesis